MGLTPTLNIGMQALDASSAALEATSNNISNANTPGYTREVPTFGENGLNDINGVVTGGGVTLEGLQSVRDELLNLQIQQQTSQQGSANTASSLLQQIQSYFSTSSGEDLASTMAAFSSSLSQLSANPGSSSVQQAVLSAGQNLAESFNTTSNGLTSTQTNADGQVTQTVASINSLSQQIAQLNVQLSETGTTANNGGTVEDQRDELVQQLSALTGISVSQSNQGEVITTGNGTPLVMGGQSFTLQTATGTNGLQQVLDSNGKNITSTITGGQLGGAIQVRDEIIPGLLTQLNTLATQFATAFNTAQATGFAPNGSVGQNFFALPSNPANAAAGITVSLSSPSLIASSSDGSAGSNGNIANLTAAITNALPSGSTPANAYANIVYQAGSAASSASAESSAISANLLQLQNQQGSVSGVSTDEEATNLIRYQTAYEAAARIVSTIEQLNSVTLNMGTSGGYWRSMRVNPNMMPDMLAAIEQSQVSLNSALQEVATGKSVNLPSDNPSAAASMVQNTIETGQVDQYTQNVNSVLSQVQTADSSLSAVVSSLTQAISLGTQGANGTNSPANQQALASQVQGILTGVVAQANLTYQGSYLFGGTANTTTPYTVDASSPTGYAYNGNNGVNSVQVGDKTSVQVNVPGSQIFSNSSANVLGSLTNLVSALQSGNTTAIGTATTAVTSALNYVSQQRVIYGNSESQLNNQESYLQQETVTLASQQNSLIGVDEATAATNLSQAELDNSAALAATAKVMPNTLLNYLSPPS